MTTALLVGIVFAVGGTGALGWWVRKLGEDARRRATEVYYEERLKVCERARNRARVEADELEHRLRAIEESGAGRIGDPAVEQFSRGRDTQLAELTGEVERLQAKLRERDAAHARLRSELDARNADRAQATGRGELSRLRTELEHAREALQERDASLSTLRVDLDQRNAERTEAAGSAVETPEAAGSSNGVKKARRKAARVREVRAQVVSAEPAPMAHDVDSAPQAAEPSKGMKQVQRKAARRARRSDGEPEAPKLTAASNGNGNGHHGPSWLLSESDGDRDDLKTINGLGPVLERGLNELGIFHYRQLAKMTADDAAWLAPRLKVYPGRLLRAGWARQARHMHLRKYKQEV